MFQCQECGRKFRTVKAAERASSVGCPKCGGVDIDVADQEEAAKSMLRSFPVVLPDGSWR